MNIYLTPEQTLALYSLLNSRYKGAPEPRNSREVALKNLHDRLEETITNTLQDVDDEIASKKVGHWLESQEDKINEMTSQDVEDEDDDLDEDTQILILGADEIDRQTRKYPRSRSVSTQRRGKKHKRR